MLPLKILATGKALPERVVTSLELDTQLGKPLGYVERRSGVRQRRFASQHDSQSALGAAALVDACHAASIAPASIDLLICASAVPQQALPYTASFVLEPAGLPAGTPAFDVNASCLGFLAALKIAASLLAAGVHRRIAIVCSDLASRGLNWQEEESALILGDGAAAVIVEAGNGASGIEHVLHETYPAGKRYCEIRAGGSQRNPAMGMIEADFRFHMLGRRLFRQVSSLMNGFLERLFLPLGLSLESVDLVVPHQASYLAMHHMRDQLALDEHRIVDIFADHGNQVAASLPTALHEALNNGRANTGQRLLLLGTAAGVTLGGMLLVL